MYAMKALASSVFRTMMFPHNRKIITINQVSHYEPNPSSNIDNITDIHYVTTSVNERMRCPCTLCESLDHFTYQCPMIIEYRHRQMALIQNHTPPPPAESVNTLTPSLEVYSYPFSLEPEALPTPPWFLDDLYEDLPPNPPNSPVHFPTEILRPTTIFNPQYLDIWFMSSEPSQSPCITPPTSSSPDDNHTVTVTDITLLDPLYSRQFHCDEDILEELTTPDCPWDALHHRSLFLSQEAFTPPNQHPIYAVETKDFIPSGHIDWFNNPIPAPDAFEEGNMANISPTIKIDISIKNGVVEEITIGAACTPEEITAYKALFQKYRTFLPGHTWRCPALTPLSSNIESTLGLISHLSAKNNDRYTHPKQRPSRLRLINYALQGSFTPSPIRHGSPTLSLLTKNRALFMSVRIFATSITPVPKTTFQHPSSTKLSMIAGHEALSFMDGFSGYNQIQIHPADQYKTTFTTPWGTFRISCHAIWPQECWSATFQ
jgi:hypothetical protein